MGCGLSVVTPEPRAFEPHRPLGAPLDGKKVYELPSKLVSVAGVAFELLDAADSHPLLKFTKQASVFLLTMYLKERVS